jgi:hypothetical protein
LDNTTSLTLVGRNYPGYGQIIADDLIHLLENGASPASLQPSNPLVGQLWFNTDGNGGNGELFVWTGLNGWFGFTTGVASIIGLTGNVTLAQLNLAGLAPINTPVFTGTPAGPTPPPGTSSTQLATTAFVTNALGAIVSGVSSVLGYTGSISLSQMISGGLAPLGSPALTGTPTAPTPAAGTHNTQIATTAFVFDQIGALSSGVSSVLGNTGAITLTELTSGGLAPIYNPTFTGTPSAPTAATGTNTTQLATTAHVQATKNALLAGANTWTAGNTYSGGIYLNNSVPINCKDTAGTFRNTLIYDSSNWLALVGGTAGTRITNSAGSVNNLLLDNSGNLTLTGNISVKGFGPAGAAQLVLESSGYGFQIRNDNANTYFLLTNNGNPAGAYNDLRPLYINNASGAVSIDATAAGTSMGGSLWVTGAIDSNGGHITANAGRVRALYGAIGSGDWNCCPILNDFYWNGGYQKLPSGIVFQWGSSNTGGGSNYVSFAPAFPSTVASIQVTALSGGIGAWMSVSGQSNVGFTVTSSNQLFGGGWIGGPVNYYWFAVGW